MPEPRKGALGATQQFDLSEISGLEGPPPGEPSPPPAPQKQPKGGALLKTQAVNVLDIQATLEEDARSSDEAALDDASLDDLYDRLDKEREEMGKKIYELQSQNLIAEPAFAKINYQIRRYEDMIKKRRESTSQSFLAKLPFFRASQKDSALLQLEFNLSEEYRKLGETAIELLHSVDRTFPAVGKYYETVETLLRKVKGIKERGRGHGN
ncbi:MAG: hypothetical protein HY815_11055 [Candidatus Riflebacteria bacterium]|nr:hypothetical protein [Candidatus Riflebacteria bacterium]